MSSYINNARHFNSIEKYLIKKLSGDNKLYSLEQLVSRKEKPTEETVKDMMNILRNVQVIAVCLQYRKNYVGVLDDEIQMNLRHLQKAKEFKVLTDVEAYKAIQCMLYQIEIDHLEGVRDLTDWDRKCLTVMLECQQEIAANIICNSLPYNNANWEIL